MMEDLILKLLLAVLVGGLVGAERELRTGIGLRTMMLISLGATLFTWQAYGKPADHETAELALMSMEDVIEFRVI